MVQHSGRGVYHGAIAYFILKPFKKKSEHGLKVINLKKKNVIKLSFILMMHERVKIGL